MTKAEVYKALIRLTGLVLGYFWITAITWAGDYLGTELIGKLIFQYLSQGLLIYLMLFQTEFLIQLLFRLDDDDSVSVGFTTKSLVSAGVILLGIYSIITSVDSIILYYLSDHKAFAADLGESTFISLRGVILAWIHLILGVLLIVFRSELCHMLFRTSGSAETEP